LKPSKACEGVLGAQGSNKEGENECNNATTLSLPLLLLLNEDDNGVLGARFGTAERAAGVQRTCLEMVGRRKRALQPLWAGAFKGDRSSRPPPSQSLRQRSGWWCSGGTVVKGDLIFRPLTN
jgi:hypothetical protein